MKKFLFSTIITISLFFIFFLLGSVMLIISYPTKYKQDIIAYYDDWKLILSVIKAESGFHVKATSSAGACGLMQILPSTAEFIAEKNDITEYDLYKPQDNIRLGCIYLQYLEGRFSGLDTILAAYNAGEGTVREWLNNKNYSSDGVLLQTIPYSETEKYVKKIKKYYWNYQRIYLTNESK